MQGKDHDTLQPQRFMKGCMRFVSCRNMIVLIEKVWIQVNYPLLVHSNT
jgi:hypothetical protein